MWALSIQQPWAYCILERGKDVENRTWWCPKRFLRQRIVIHAGKRMDCEVIHGRVYLPNAAGQPGIIAREECPTGVLLGTVEIVECVRHHPSKWACEEQNQFVLRAPRSFRAVVPWRGALGFFEVPDEVVLAAERGGEETQERGSEEETQERGSESPPTEEEEDGESKIKSRSKSKNEEGEGEREPGEDDDLELPEGLAARLVSLKTTMMKGCRAEGPGPGAGQLDMFGESRRVG